MEQKGFSMRYEESLTPEELRVMKSLMEKNSCDETYRFAMDEYGQMYVEDISCSYRMTLDSGIRFLSEGFSNDSIDGLNEEDRSVYVECMKKFAAPYDDSINLN